MTELGYDRYAVPGGDWGSTIGTALAGLHPESVVALHLTDVPFDLAFTIDENFATEAEVAYLNDMSQFADGQVYLSANTAQPDMTALALTDSPAGLLGWLTHLDDQWSQEPISTEDLLAAASLMWLTGTVRSSMRLYSEPAAAWDGTSWEEGTWDDESQDPEASSTGQDSNSWAPAPVEAPTAFALFPKDLGMAPRALADQHFNVERFTVMPRGGHFAALEQPEPLAEDIVTFLAQRT